MRIDVATHFIAKLSSKRDFIEHDHIAHFVGWKDIQTKLSLLLFGLGPQGSRKYKRSIISQKKMLGNKETGSYPQH
jgi:hypothetical protein